MKKSISLLLGFLFAGVAFAQTPAPQVNPFSITAGAVSLPGSNNSTLAGTLAGFSLKVTPNFSLEQTSFITSSARTNAFLGGGSYTFGKLSKALNNTSSTLNGYDFRFSVHGDVGQARITDASGASIVGMAALFGGQVDYAIKGSSRYSLGVRIDDFYVKHGLPRKNNLVIALGPAIHF